jgi:probable addiction module antidote protein
MSDDLHVGDLPQWDAADHLTTPELQAEYLSMVMEDGEADEIRAALSAIARARGMKELAEACNTNRQGLYASLGKDGNPAFGTVLKLIRSLGLTLSVHTR